MDGAMVLCVSHAGPVGRGSTHYDNDVFLSSAGGSDAAPESFPSGLRAGLAAAGFSVCGTDESQVVGSSSRLPHPALQRSRIGIPIFSKDSASSERFLREVVQMMEGKRSSQQKVWPIFNRVNPRHVRQLEESFAKARHSDIEGVQEALAEVGYFTGFTVADENEEEIVKTVVQYVPDGLRPDFYRVFESRQYNVFLNFRGPDTRSGITNCLYNDLLAAGLSVFKDDRSLPIGEDFRPQLLSAITRSTIYITIFSETYTSSKWCLLEVAKMKQCVDNKGHVFYPIFYDVDILDAMNLTGNFRDALNSRAGAAKGGLPALKEVAESSDRLGIEPDEQRLPFHVRFIVLEVLGKLRDHFQLDVPRDVEDSMPPVECVIS